MTNGESTNPAVLPLVLIVEDSAVASGALRLLFEESGMRVAIAASVAEALDAAAVETPDAVLLDLRLPDGDGLSLLDTWQRNDAMPKTIYALTGTDDPAVVQRAKAAGCDDVILKPAKAMELLRRIKAAVAS